MCVCGGGECMLTAAAGDPKNRAGDPPLMPYLTWGPREADHPEVCVWPGRKRYTPLTPSIHTHTLCSLEIDHAKTRGQAQEAVIRPGVSERFVKAPSSSCRGRRRRVREEVLVTHCFIERTDLFYHGWRDDSNSAYSMEKQIRGNPYQRG